MRRYFARTLLYAVTAFTIVFAAEFWLEWSRLGMPGMSAISWASVNNPKLVDLLSPVARAYNNILAMLLATIGLAIPITANMHTPKLIEMFLRDRLNQIVLVLGSFFAANVLWVDYLVGPQFAPMWAVRFAVFGALFGWALLVPYFFYIMRFLDPSSILRRLQQDIEHSIVAVKEGRLDADEAQSIVHERVHQIGTIVIKSLERADRGVAVEGIWIFKRLLDFHGTCKDQMPAKWFVVDRKDFVGLTDDALALVQEERVFFERKVLSQLLFAYKQALSKASDVAPSICDANRVVAQHAVSRGDDEALHLSIRYFNNFLRESVRIRHVHSIHDAFHQYFLLARSLVGKGRPELRDIVRYLSAYADAAQAAGMHLVPAFAAFDLGSIAIEAERKRDDGATAIIEHVSAIPNEAGGKFEPLVVQAKLKLGALLLAHGSKEAAAHVRGGLAGVDAAKARRLADEMINAKRDFYEVTDRQVDLRWLHEQEREPLVRFVETLGA